MCFIPPPYIVIKSVSSMLPIVHDVAHNILSIDRDLVHWTLNNDHLTHNVKSFIILFSIQLAQMADHIGSDMLNLYYHTIKFLLEQN